MVAIYSDSAGKPQTLHVTYLTSDGKKAHVESTRKILSSIEPGGSVRLFDIDENDKDLYIAEGIETALSVAKIHGVKCWAVLNTALMEQFKPPAHIKNVIICADNDINYSGQKAAYTLANRLMIAGTGALVDMPAKMGTDFNDELRAV